MGMSRRAAAIALVAYLAVLVAATLGGSPGALFAGAAQAAQDLGGLEWVTDDDVERTANVLLFVPAGLLLCYAFPALSRWLVWAVWVAVSVSIEAAQVILPDRDASMIDVATNSCGAAIGVLLHWGLAALRSSPRRVTER